MPEKATGTPKHGKRRVLCILVIAIAVPIFLALILKCSLGSSAFRSSMPDGPPHPAAGYALQQQHFEPYHSVASARTLKISASP